MQTEEQKLGGLETWLFRTGLLRWSTDQSCPHLLTHLCGFSFMGDLAIIFSWHNPSPFTFSSFFFLCLCYMSISLSFITVPFPIFLVLGHMYFPMRINSYIRNNVRQVYIPYLKHMIQSSTRNSILGIYGWIQLSASHH